jgi:hypothetical protein
LTAPGNENTKYNKRGEILFYKSILSTVLKTSVPTKIRVNSDPPPKQNAINTYSECRCKPPLILNLAIGRT